jgi:ADP-ribose pyrophosphatase YjhB (NUDIX family)
MMTLTEDKARSEVLKLYGNRLRLRVCGLLRDGNQLLMVRHRGINQSDTFWCPPGGGLQFGEATREGLTREFDEETGLRIEVGDMLFVNEFREPPLHALELFFQVHLTSGTIRQGMDPEMSLDGQIIEEVRLMTFDEIKSYPPEEVHTLFQRCHSIEDVFSLRGFLAS